MIGREWTVDHRMDAKLFGLWLTGQTITSNSYHKGQWRFRVTWKVNFVGRNYTATFVFFYFKGGKYWNNICVHIYRRLAGKQVSTKKSFLHLLRETLWYFSQLSSVQSDKRLDFILVDEDFFVIFQNVD